MAIIYHSAAVSYFFLTTISIGWPPHRPFEAALANVIRLDRYLSHFYRPVIEIYFHIGRQLFGCNPLPFHVLNIGIHLVNTLLLFLFARALTDRLSFAGLTALLFCVQPGYTEAVAWVSAVSELLPATWFLLTLWLHLAVLRGRGAQFYALSLVTFVTCLLTHERSAVLLPMMIALEATLSWSFDWRRGAPLCAVRPVPGRLPCHRGHREQPQLCRPRGPLRVRLARRAARTPAWSSHST